MDEPVAASLPLMSRGQVKQGKTSKGDKPRGVVKKVVRNNFMIPSGFSDRGNLHLEADALSIGHHHM